MADVLSLEQVILLIIVATLGAIVYGLRVLAVTEKRIARMDYNIERLVLRLLKEEVIVEHELSTKLGVKKKKKKKVRKRR